MSLDRSLKTGGGLSKHRNVLTRAERITKLNERGKFNMETGNPLSLVKVGNRKLRAVKVDKKKDAVAGAVAGAVAAPAAAGKAVAGKAAAGKAAPAAKGGKK